MTIHFRNSAALSAALKSLTPIIADDEQVWQGEDNSVLIGSDEAVADAELNDELSCEYSQRGTAADWRRDLGIASEAELTAEWERQYAR